METGDTIRTTVQINKPYNYSEERLKFGNSYYLLVEK